MNDVVDVAGGDDGDDDDEARVKKTGFLFPAPSRPETRGGDQTDTPNVKTPYSQGAAGLFVFFVSFCLCSSFFRFGPESCPQSNTPSHRVRLRAWSRRGRRRRGGGEGGGCEVLRSVVFWLRNRRGGCRRDDPSAGPADRAARRRRGADRGGRGRAPRPCGRRPSCC